MDINQIKFGHSFLTKIIFMARRRRSRGRRRGGSGFSIGGIFRSLFSVKGVIIGAIVTGVVLMVPALKSKAEGLVAKIKPE